ncbi:TfoX/Sxy family protein [Companilactobacillus musae]|uniref:TfoX/Sxy family protein n=1 Tax=Companilactobacillus musae TaxID=1903258 RepID=UPI000E64AA0F|nr:TfoX/Sxy family protein [Companilactobacillus musae]
MTRLIELPNIGKVLDQQLSKINITNEDELDSLGSKETFLKLKSLNAPERFYCIQMLYSLEGAIEDVPYTELSDDKKQELLVFFRKNN